MFNLRQGFPVLLLAGLAFAASAAPQAKVIKIEGQAEFRPAADRPWAPLQPNGLLGENAEVRTGERATVTLSIENKGIITLHELSLVTLASLKGSERQMSVGITVGSGKVWNKFKKKDAADQSTMVIQTPAAVASVRGTAFFVESEAATMTTRIGVWEGSVGVESATLKGETKKVDAGFEILVLYNQPLTDPRKMAMQELQRQQQFEESMKSLGLIGMLAPVRGMAEMNEMQLNEAADIVNQAGLRQRGEKLVREDFKKLKQAIARLYADTGYYPGANGNKATGKKSLLCLVENQDSKGNPIPGWNGPYIDSDFKDPYSGFYGVYLRPGKVNTFMVLVSLGLDRAISEDDIEDIYSLTALKNDTQALKNRE